MLAACGGACTAPGEARLLRGPEAGHEGRERAPGQGVRTRTLDRVAAGITVGWIGEAGLEAGGLGRNKAGRDEAGRGLDRNTERQNR